MRKLPWHLADEAIRLKQEEAPDEDASEDEDEFARETAELAEIFGSSKPGEFRPNEIEPGEDD